MDVWCALSRVLYFFHVSCLQFEQLNDLHCCSTKLSLLHVCLRHVVGQYKQTSSIQTTGTIRIGTHINTQPYTNTSTRERERVKKKQFRKSPEREIDRCLLLCIQNAFGVVSKNGRIIAAKDQNPINE